MALQTPKSRPAGSGLQRPSLSTFSTTSSPSLRASATDINRKASLQALTGQVPVTPARMDADLEVGDEVNVPGEMHGVVKFVGSVRGKAGQFVGVELASQFAARGKNNGDVDGIHYFQTTIPGAGIFLPVHRAERRSSPSTSEPLTATPTTPSFKKKPINGANKTTADHFATPAIKPKLLSQSVGPGARPPSPNFKPKRPSLPRPESPLRRQAPTLAPTPARGLSQSQIGGSKPSINQTPVKPNLRATTTSRPSIPANGTRPYSRNGSRAGHRAGSTIDEEETTTTAGRGMAFSQSVRSPSRQGLGSAGGQHEEIQKLRAQLAERDHRLDEQAASLAEMEQSVKELTAFLPADGGAVRSPNGDEEDRTVAQLRQMLREKNEKISKLTAEFDAHRADFRSTLDSLEMASTETERVYEEQKRDMLAQIAELQEAGQSKEDFEGVAQQLKQLEELVAELEEGLEESRRGEAEARGEVEFLRGEVERGRSELRREREKAAAAMKHTSFASSGSSIKDLEQRDDEIRGLKAIIHSLSEAGNMPDTKATSIYSANDEEEIRRLQKALDDMRLEKESLENEVETLHRERGAGVTQSNGVSHIHARNESELTERALLNGTTSKRPRSNTIKASSLMRDRLNASVSPGEGHPTGRAATTAAAAADDDDDAQHHGDSGDIDNDRVYCEMCESADHDTLDCRKLNANRHAQASQKLAQQDAGAVGGASTAATSTESHMHKPKTESTDLGKENINDSKTEARKDNTADTADKWCALCEKDGHLAYDCPEEQY